MCAIIDANVVSEAFGSERPEAGKKFFEWINDEKGVLVVGGKLRDELDRSENFLWWAQNAILAERLRSQDDARVRERTREIEREGTCWSDDPHIVALAQISGARLLYTNDKTLQRDFNNRKLIKNPRGKVYSTLVNKKFMPSHKQLLANRELCGSIQ